MKELIFKESLFTSNSVDADEIVLHIGGSTPLSSGIKAIKESQKIQNTIADFKKLTVLKEEKVTPNILKHMDHEEDLIYYGKQGIAMMVNTLNDVIDAMSSNIPKYGTKLTVKIDGSPAVVVASDYHGDKFIALKGSWDKGKVFRSESEINDSYKEEKAELRDKLIVLFRCLDKLSIPKDEIWMGDYLFSQPDLKEKIIDGEQLITFMPNTVVYAVPLDDPLAEKIKKAKVGVAWHTKYTGPDFENLRKSFDVSVDSLPDVSEVYQIDAHLPGLKDSIIFNKNDSELLLSSLNALKEDAYTLAIDPKYYELLENKKVTKIMQAWKNEVIRTYRSEIGHFSYNEILDLVTRAWDSKIASLVAKNAIAKNTLQKEEMLTFIQDHKETLEQFYQVQAGCIAIKNKLVSKLSNVLGKNMKSFYLDVKDNYIPCNGEGFVVSDIDGNVAKLVTRIDFSLANWDPNIVKGWMSDKRQQNAEPMHEAKASTVDKYMTADEKSLIAQILEQNNYEPLNLSNITVAADSIDPAVKIIDNRPYIFVRYKDNTKSRDEAANSLAELLQSYGITDAVSYQNAGHPELSFSINSRPFVFRFKPSAGTRSGKGSAAFTVEQENIFCYLISSDYNGDFTETSDELKERLKITEKFSNYHIDQWWNNIWYDNYCRICPEIRAMFGEKPIIVCRSEYSKNSDDEVYPIMTGKENITKYIRTLFGKNETTGVSIKDWSTADVWVVDSDRYDEMIASIQSLAGKSLQSVNQFFVTAIQERSLVGVSLKGSIDKATLESGSFTIKNTEIETDSSIALNYIGLPFGVPSNLSKTFNVASCLSIGIEKAFGDGSRKQYILYLRCPGGANNKVSFSMPIDGHQTSWCSEDKYLNFNAPYMTKFNDCRLDHISDKDQLSITVSRMVEAIKGSSLAYKMNTLNLVNIESENCRTSLVSLFDSRYNDTAVSADSLLYKIYSRQLEILYFMAMLTDAERSDYLDRIYHVCSRTNRDTNGYYGPYMSWE